mmetsp:Transcript_16588/g.24494  ORF Transcript_16588/g.24494 Transcript_16588/m.24494 type:complete len:374 (+) Transcript_16588:142-1263(+)
MFRNLSLLINLLVPLIISSFSLLSPSLLRTKSHTSLRDGQGITNGYEWIEDSTEIEIRVKVPKHIRAKDIRYRAKPLSVDLRYVDENTEEEIMLLNGTRTFRGRVAMDGTFWNLEDGDAEDESHTVVVTVEKNIRAPKDDFEIVEFDWGGVYPDDEEEVLSKTYVEPEELDLRDYAGKMGVDIDNLNMSLVDKTMFSSGLNMTRSTMEELSKRGHLNEVTQQGDGSEFTTDDEGNAVPFSPYGKGVSAEEVKTAIQIPFLDTNSPWKAAKPSYKMDELTKEMRQFAEEEEMKNAEKSGEKQPCASTATKVGPKDSEKLSPREAPDSDPQTDAIKHLTVTRLKEILRREGLKVSGSKKELQQRLNSHFLSKMKP